jgi:hypothetical protein
MPWESRVIMTKSAASVALAAAVLMHAAFGQDRASDDNVDPVALKLQKAKAAYEAELKKLQMPVLKELDKIKQKARESGDLEKLVAAKEATAAFEKSNKLPDRLPAKQFRNSYARLRDQIERALVEAKQAYTSNGKVEEAIRVAKDLEKFRAAAWDPRPTRPREHRSIDVKSDNHVILHYYLEKLLERDLQAKVELFTREGSFRIQGIGAQGEVLCTHPINTQIPATIDLGDLTVDKTGALALLALGYPRTDGGRVVVKLDGQIFCQMNVTGTDAWQKILIPLRGNRVVVEHHAVGWGSELMFFDWSIANEARSPGMPRPKKK